MKIRFLIVAPAFFLLCFFVARAAQLIINTGTTANDATGDTLRVSFQKVNSNFTELYTAGFTNGFAAAGNGMVKSGTNLHFATNAPYTTGLIPFATGTNLIGFGNLFFDSANSQLTIGTAVDGDVRLTLLSDGSSGTPLREGLFIGTGLPTVTDNILLYQDTGNGVLVGHGGSGSRTFSINGASAGSQFSYMKFYSGGHADVVTQFRLLQVGPSAIVATDANTNAIALTVGTGLSLDTGTMTLSGVSTGGVAYGLGSANTLPKWSATNALTFIANGTGFLTNDGSGGFGFSTNIAQDVTINNLTITSNLTVNTITVQSNLTVNNNLTVSNLYTVNGNHNTLIVTQAMTLNSLKTNLLAVTSSGLVTNAKYGSGISWDTSTLTLSAVGTDTTATNIVTLTQTTTNVSQLDFSLVQNGGAFKLTLTGNGYVGAPANVGNTVFRKAWLLVQQPSTGTCLLQFTNGHYAWPEGVSPIIDTNNGAVSVFEFVTDVFTNGLIHGSMVPLSKLATNM